LAALICATVLTLAGLWAASSVMTPVAFAVFIIALVWPLQRRLQAGLPQVIAVLVTAGVALLAIGLSGWRRRSPGDDFEPIAGSGGSCWASEGSRTG